MRKVRKGQAAALLLLGLLAPVALARGADAPATPSGGESWWGRWFGGKEKTAAKTSSETDDPAALPQPSQVERGLQEQDRHWRAYLRRLDVVTKLKQIALDTGNEDLARQADELDQQVNALAQRKLAGGVPGGQKDMATLDRRLNAGTALPQPTPTVDVEARAARLLEGKR